MKKTFLDLRIVVLAVGLIGLVVLRQLIQSFGVSLGYLYITLISLAGFWFGVRGGLIAALVAALICILELSHFSYWQNRSIAMMGMSLRILVYILTGLSIGYFATEEKKLKEKLQALSQFDELTGCVNYRWAMKLLENEILRAKRYHNEMSVVLIDLDHFKKVNDTYGHLVGNDVLRIFAQVLAQSVRNVDTVCRYGGEEFLLILPEASLQQAAFVLQRIKSKLAQTKITSTFLKAEKSLGITFSAGGAAFPLNGDKLESLIHIADTALYQAKQSGRNRSIVDRRRWARVKPPGDFKLEITQLSTSDFQRFEIENIGVGGMLILFPQAVSYARNVLVLFPQRFPYVNFSSTLNIPGKTYSYDVQCKVIHQSKQDQSWHRVGVQFLDLAKDREEKLAHYLQSQEVN
ncbi:MAG: diguanylate cyclase [Candidatus Omnitrophota bacterium]